MYLLFWIDHVAKWCVIVHCSKESRPKFSWRITMNFWCVSVPPGILLVFHFWAMRRQLAASLLGMWLNICSWIISTQSAALSSCARLCQETDVADDQHSQFALLRINTKPSRKQWGQGLVMHFPAPCHSYLLSQSNTSNHDACLLLLRLPRVLSGDSWRSLEHPASNKFLQQPW